MITTITKAPAYFNPIMFGRRRVGTFARRRCLAPCCTRNDDVCMAYFR